MPRAKPVFESTVWAFLVACESGVVLKAPCTASVPGPYSLVIARAILDCEDPVA